MVGDISTWLGGEQSSGRQQKEKDIPEYRVPELQLVSTIQNMDKGGETVFDYRGCIAARVDY